MVPVGMLCVHEMPPLLWACACSTAARPLCRWACQEKSQVCQQNRGKGLGDAVVIAIPELGGGIGGA
jgi:hypothetical protein